MTAEFESAASCWKAILSDVIRNKGLLSLIERFARENTAPAKIVFGTSGWRGEIGTDFTFHNVRIVTAAIIEMLRSNGHHVTRLSLAKPSMDEVYLEYTGRSLREEQGDEERMFALRRTMKRART